MLAEAIKLLDLYYLIARPFITFNIFDSMPAFSPAFAYTHMGFRKN
jgi:hypothetical protein